MVMKPQQVICDDMPMEFEATGTGGRYCQQQKEHALKLADDYGARAVARIHEIPR